MILAAAALLLAQPDCATATTQLAMNQCASNRVRAATAELDRVYALVLRQMQTQLPGEGERRLREAQRAWAGYRDAQCQLAGIGAQGGSMEMLLVSGCTADMTERRANELLMMIR